MPNAKALQGHARALALLTTVVGAVAGCDSTSPAGHGAGGATGTGGVVSAGGTQGGGGSGGGGAAGGSPTSGVGGAGGGGTNGGGAGGATIADAGCTGAACSVDAGSADAAAPACSQLTTQSACDLRADCHAVFTSGSICSCDGGSCCMQFSRCADGNKADCAGPALCDAMTPRCPAPYAVGYAGSCYEGCVRQSACPSPTCPSVAPSDGTSCGPVDYKCFYESCATTGRTLATCSGGAWKIETAACSTITCAGGGITPTSLTCDAGKVCVVVTSTGGAYMVTPMCVSHTCGTGPVTPQCIPTTGSCSLTTGLGGVFVQCSYSSCSAGQGGCA